LGKHFPPILIGSERKLGRKKGKEIKKKIDLFRGLVKKKSRTGKKH
jgi:hypothetical protein